MSRVIVDTACLVGLERIGRLELLTETFAGVVIPSAVAEEFGSVPKGISIDDPKDRTPVRLLKYKLGAGEAEVIALAEERAGSLAILDDGPARREARAAADGHHGRAYPSQKAGSHCTGAATGGCSHQRGVSPLRRALRAHVGAGRRTLIDFSDPIPSGRSHCCQLSSFRLIPPTSQRSFYQLAAHT